MANTNQNWYPSQTGNASVDYALRQAFDHIYGLRDTQAANLSGTVQLPAGSFFNGRPVTNLVFKDGSLVSTS